MKHIRLSFIHTHVNTHVCSSRAEKNNGIEDLGARVPYMLNEVNLDCLILYPNRFCTKYVLPKQNPQIYYRCRHFTCLG